MIKIVRMPPKKKIVSEIGMDDEGYAVVPKEVLPPAPEVPVIPEAKLKAKVKREMSEAQRLNMLKVIEANRVRWAEKKKAKEEAEKDSKIKKREEEESLIKAGTHVRVKIEPTKKHKPKEKPPVEEESAEEDEEESFQAPRPRERAQAKKSQRVPPPPPSTDEETTDSGTDDDYKPKKRAVRKEIKKNLKALKAIDEVIETTASNPYLAYLSQKWK
jgi:hypothetical protein